MVSGELRKLVVVARTRTRPTLGLAAGRLRSGPCIIADGRGIALVRPPRQYDLHPMEVGGTSREPPAEDTVLTGTLEVVMKERRRVRAISIGVQSVCRLNMLGARGWEEDGVFERGVEILGGDDEEGIWLEKGSQR